MDTRAVKDAPIKSKMSLARIETRLLSLPARGPVTILNELSRCRFVIMSKIFWEAKQCNSTEGPRCF